MQTEIIIRLRTICKHALSLAAGTDCDCVSASIRYEFAKYVVPVESPTHSSAFFGSQVLAFAICFWTVTATTKPRSRGRGGSRGRGRRSTRSNPHFAGVKGFRYRRGRARTLTRTVSRFKLPCPICSNPFTLSLEARVRRCRGRVWVGRCC